MKTGLKRLGIGLALVSVLVIGAAATLLGTRPGVQWLLETASHFIPGELAVEHAEGNLLGKLRLRGLSYRDTNMSLEAGEVILDWLPYALFGGVFHLQELTVEKLRYAKLRETEEQSSAAIKPPDIELPIRLRLDLVQAKSMEVVPAPQAAPVIIDQLVLVANWGAAGVNLSKLELAMPDLKFHGSGKILPRGAYPLDLDLNWEFSAAGLPRVAGKGRLEGDLESLQLQHRIAGDVEAGITANVHDPLQGLTWDARVQIDKVPREYLPLDETASLDLDVDARGDLARMDSRIAFEVEAAKDKATVKAQQLLLNLVASMEFAEQRFKLHGDWQNLQWPLTGAARIAASTGKLEAAGVPDSYVFSLQTALRGDGIPPGDWQAEGKGSLDKLRLDRLLGKILDGTLAAVGDLAWSPALAWKMDLIATDINPQALNAQWPGKLSAAVATSGELPDSGLQLQAQIRELRGSLREKPVAGGGKVRINGSTLLLEDLLFRSGQAKIGVSGELGDAWDLQWKLDVPDLADLLPQGEGAIHGAGKLRGSQEQPVIEGMIEAAALLANEIECGQCKADFSVGLEETFVSRVLITGTDVLASGQRMSSLSLQLDGPLQRQSVKLNVDHKQGELRFIATGAYLQEQTAWQGEIQTLGLEAGEIGNWKLQQSASLFASAREIKLSPLCLQDRQALLCVQIRRGEDAGKAKLTLKDLSLERARPWLPPEITQLTGALNLNATADLGAVPEANIEATLEPGELAYLGPQSKPITLKLHEGKLNAVYDQQRLAVQLTLGLGANLLQGKLLVPRGALDKNPMEAPLQGDAKIVVKNLSLVTAFVPDIQKIDGNIDVALTLGGQLGDPRLSGHALLKSDEVVIPRAGLELKDLLVQVEAKGGDQLELSGVVHSGEGKLDLQGKVLLDAEQGWPANLMFRGDRFQLVNLPEAQVVITPDLSLESSREVIRIRGKLDVPVALIEVHNLPAGSRDVSADVVVVSKDGSVEEKTKSRIDAEVAITLGGDVHFSGFGLDADLGGKLTIDQNPGKVATASGELNIESGSFRAYGQNLTIEKGRISYAGGRIDNPGLRLRASRKTGDTTVGVEVAGTARKPKISTFSSDPDMREKDVISMLLTGQKTGDLSEAKIYTGRQITPDLSVGVNLGAGEEGSEFVARYKLRDNVNLEGTSSARKSGASINYTIELE